MLGIAAQFANDVILVFSLAGRLLEANERFYDLYGYRHDDVADITLSDIRSLSCMDSVPADLKRAEDEGGVTFETEHRRKDGSVFPVEVSSRVVEIKGTRCAVSIVRDITEMKAAAARIAGMNCLFQTVTAAHQALLHSSSDDEVFAGICSVATAFGLKMAWVGLVDGNEVTPVRWSGNGSEYLAEIMIRVDPDDPRSWGPTGKAIRLGVPVVCNDFQNDPQTAPWHERGRAYGWGASAAFPLFRRSRTCGAFTIYSDRPDFFGPDEVNLLEDLAGNISFLLDQIDIRNENRELEGILQKSLQSLLDVNIELERFAEIYSHDLQEPVRNVVSFTQFLERRLSGQLDAETQLLLKTIVEAAMRIRQLNFDLLEFSRSRHLQTALACVDSETAVQYACGELEASLEQAGAQIRLHPPLPQVLGNEAELRQVFINLLSNAIKFASPMRPLTIDVTATPESGGWHFTIQDNGIGIEEQYLDKVFTVFFRLHALPEYPGSGVGLAITRKIIDRHDGRIWIESRYGVGTSVHFWLHAVK